MKGPTEYTRRGVFNIFSPRRPELRPDAPQPKPTDALPQTPIEAHLRMNAALERYLGLTPAQAEIHLMLGDHFAADHVLEKVREEGVTVLGGEIRHNQIGSALSSDLPVKKSYIDRVRSRATFPLGSEDPQDHPKKANATRTAVQTLFDSGVTFATTDGSTMTKESTTPDNVETPLGTLNVNEGLKEGAIAVAVVGGILTFVGSREKRNSSEAGPPPIWARRKFIASFATAAGAIATGRVFQPTLAPILRERPEASMLYDPVVDSYYKAQIAYEQAVLEAKTMGLDDAEFATFNERRIKYRNQVMALNMWHSIALNQAAQGANTAKESYLMTAGSGHIGLAEEFPRGPEELSNELGELADHICGDFLDDLFAAQERIIADPAVIEKPDIWDIRDVVVSAAALFTEPQLISNKPKHIPLIPGNQIPPNARTVFIDRLKRKLEEYRSHPTRETKDRMLVLQYSLDSLLAQNLVDSSYLAQTLNSIPYNTSTDPHLDTLLGSDAFHEAEILINGNRRQAELDQGRHVSRLIAWSQVKGTAPFRFYLGNSIRISGRYIPLVRRVEIDTDHDQVIISDGLNAGAQQDIVVRKFVCDRIPPRGNSMLSQVNTEVSIKRALTEAGTRMPTASMQAVKIAIPNFDEAGSSSYDRDKRVYAVPGNDPFGVQYVTIDEDTFDQSTQDTD